LIVPPHAHSCSWARCRTVRVTVRRIAGRHRGNNDDGVAEGRTVETRRSLGANRLYGAEEWRSQLGRERMKSGASEFILLLRSVPDLQKLAARFKNVK
jgi:hypothetical protein